MTIKINETNVIVELDLTDPRSGQNWILDFIGNTGAFNDGQFTYDDENDIYVCSQETFDWWKNIVIKYEVADELTYDFEQELKNREDLGNDYYEEFRNDLGNACCCDLEDMPSIMMDVVNEWEDKLTD